MEQRFKNLSLFEFQERFSTPLDYLEYRTRIKWRGNYKYRKCGHNRYCSGKSKLSRQWCTYRKYLGSPSEETTFGGQEESVKDRKNGTKKLMVVGIEKKKRGVSRLYARKTPNVDDKSLGGFMKYHIDLSANVTTDQWTEYAPLKKDFENLVCILPYRKGKNFSKLHRIIKNHKGWLKIYRHVENPHDHFDRYYTRGLNLPIKYKSIKLFL